MIVTKSWLNEWIDLSDITTERLAKTLNSIGLEVDRVKEYRIPSKIVFGKVLSCEKHPDADKLNVCQVDLGSATRQIVCGAANVREGLFVAVATVGAVMPNGMEIKPVKLRGVDSEGMICSASELGLADIGNGIMELDESIGSFELGEELSCNSYLNDDLIEIELTANRGDCLSIRGVARDLSAALDKKLKEYSVTDNDEKRGIGRILSLVHEKDFDVNLRYKAVDLKELRLPFIVQLRLAQIEEKRESAVESIMLYVTHATGVILRAYEHDFFVTSEDEKMGKIILAEDENGFAVIKNRAKQVASVVGIIQYDISKVKKSEGTVVLEASYIPPDIISKKMSESKIEAGPLFYKTSRGSEPELEGGLSYCIDLIESCSNSTTFSGNIELSKTFREKSVIVTKQEIDAIIGMEIDKSLIAKILKNLGFDTSKSTPDKFVVTVPQFRHDIVNKQDIIEEIVRMVGIDNIASKPSQLQEANRLEDNYFAYKKRLKYRQKAAQSGFFESVHFVFDEKKVLQEYGFETTKEELELLNPIVQTFDTLRPTLLTGLLKAASHNVKNGYASVALFELGSVFNPLREESLRLSFLFSGEREHESLGNAGKAPKIDFGLFVQKIADVIGDVTLREQKTAHMLSHPYQSAAILQKGRVVGELFKVHPEVQKAYDLDVTYMCELDFEALDFSLKTAKERSKYQASFRDLSLLVPKDLAYEKIEELIKGSNIANLVRFYPVDRYSDDSLGENISLSVRFVLQSDEKTLEEEDIAKVTDTILELLDKEMGIGLR